MSMDKPQSLLPRGSVLDSYTCRSAPVRQAGTQSAAATRFAPPILLWRLSAAPKASPIRTAPIARITSPARAGLTHRPSPASSAPAAATTTSMLRAYNRESISVGRHTKMQGGTSGIELPMDGRRPLHGSGLASGHAVSAMGAIAPTMRGTADAPQHAHMYQQQQQQQQHWQQQVPSQQHQQRRQLLQDAREQRDVGSHMDQGQQALRDGAQRQRPEEGEREPGDRQLTQMISKAPSVSQLHTLCLRHGPRLNFIHVSAAIVALAKLADRTPPQPRPAATATTYSAGRPGRGSGRGPGAAAGASLQHRPWLEETAACAELVASLVECHVNVLQPRAVANCLWAAAKLSASLAVSLPEAAAAGGSSDSPSASAWHPREQLQELDAEGNPVGFPPLLAPPMPLEVAQRRCMGLACQLLGRVPGCLPEFEPQHISNTALAIGTLVLVQQQQQQQQQQLQQQHCEGEGAVGEAVATGAMSLQGLPQLIEPKALLEGLVQRSWPLLLEFGPQALANLMHSLAAMGHQPPEDWLSDCLDASEGQLALFEPQHISMTLWALAKMGFHPGDEWLAAALGALVLKLPLCSPQALANTLWAIAQLCQEEAPEAATLQPQEAGGPLALALQPLLLEVMSQSPIFTSQDCSNCLWALAVLRRSRILPDDPDLDLGAPGGDRDSRRQRADGPVWLQCCLELLERAATCRASASPQQLCNTLWAASLLLPLTLLPQNGDGEVGGRDDGLAAATDGSDRLRSPDLARSGRSGSRSGVSSDLEPEVVASWLLQTACELIRCMEQCTAQELSNAVISCARLQVTLPGPADGTTGWWPSFWAASYSVLQQAEPRHLSGMLWGAARAGRVPPGAWTRGVLRALAQQATVSGQSLACVMWAFSRLGILRACPDRGLPTPLARLLLRVEAMAVAGSMRPQGLIMAVRAIAYMLINQERTAAGRQFYERFAASLPGGLERGDGARGDGDGPSAGRLVPLRPKRKLFSEEETSPDGGPAAGNRGVAVTIGGESVGISNSDGDLKASQRIWQQQQMRSAQLQQRKGLPYRVSRSLALALLSKRCLAEAGPRELVSGAAALARLPAESAPRDGVARLATAAEALVPRLGLRELGVLLVSLARLGHRPGPTLLEQGKRRAMHLMPDERRQGVRAVGGAEDLPQSRRGSAPGASGSTRTLVLAMQQEQLGRGEGTKLRGGGAGGGKASEGMMASMVGLSGGRDLLDLIARIEGGAVKGAKRSRW